MADQNEQQEVMEQLKALGYIDPGAGSSMWQVMLASLLRFSARVRGLFGKNSEQDED